MSETCPTCEMVGPGGTVAVNDTPEDIEHWAGLGYKLIGPAAERAVAAANKKAAEAALAASVAQQNVATVEGVVGTRQTKAQAIAGAKAAAKAAKEAAELAEQERVQAEADAAAAAEAEAEAAKAQAEADAAKE